MGKFKKIEKINILLYILIITLLSLGCNNQNINVKQVSTKTDTIDIKNQKTDNFPQSEFDSIDAKTNAMYQISGKILYKKIWCGGVQVGPEFYKIRPFINKKILIINGSINSDTCRRITELRTNAKGEFNFEVKPGLYGLIAENWKQVKFKQPVCESWELACLRKAYKKPDILIRVTDKPVSKLSYTVIVYCSGGNPCNPLRGADRP
ncbi:MAG: hypothetical protein NTW49_08295 [Bacteroidia bacterium]|nr:hypothetical protein [Bacteroidia bacterium]